MCFALPNAVRHDRIYVWDFPTRLFHWTLAASVIFAGVTGFNGGNGMDLHGQAGVVIVGLIAFRLAWGFLGSTYARFATFLRGPAAIRAYLRGQWCGAGHNPLGALSVLALLAVLAFHVGTGLFANDDIAFNGPLYALVDKHTSDWLTGWHRRSVWLLLALVAVHLAAIAYYRRIKNDNLVRPMLTGWKDSPPKGSDSATGGGFFAFLAAVAVGVAVAFVAAGGLVSAPPVPEVSAPAW